MAKAQGEEGQAFVAHWEFVSKPLQRRLKSPKDLNLGINHLRLHAPLIISITCSYTCVVVTLAFILLILLASVAYISTIL